MISFTSFWFFLLSLLPTSAALTPEVGVVESLGFLRPLLSCQYSFLSFLAFSDGSDPWVEADAGADAEPLEALELSPQWSFPAPWVWTLCAVV